MDGDKYHECNEVWDSPRRSLSRNEVRGVKLVTVIAALVLVFIIVCVAVVCVVVSKLGRNHHKISFSMKNAVYDKRGAEDEAPDRIIIQRRTTGDVNFTRTWKEYRNGFGDLDGDFWFGNENIHKLTRKGYTRLHIELTTFDDITYNIEYGDFRVRPEAEQYQLIVANFKPGHLALTFDCLISHNGSRFTTIDRDNDRAEDNCASLYFGGWWYNSCQLCNLNGLYRSNEIYKRGNIIWCAINRYRGIKQTLMTIQQHP
ncbi:ficolin-2-like [Haliotis rufescens]|uniref:ficolin-2-like n=1 Tax=Haliotis rufescens TaxID=6454 RepID=UPI001EAFCA2B|nr:ficolin-2-like [Haliotis rufescens]